MHKRKAVIATIMNPLNLAAWGVLSVFTAGIAGAAVFTTLLATAGLCHYVYVTSYHYPEQG